MSYDEVVEIIGGEGEIVTETGEKGSEFYGIGVIYEGNGEAGGNATIKRGLANADTALRSAMDRLVSPEPEDANIQAAIDALAAIRSELPEKISRLGDIDKDQLRER